MHGEGAAVEGWLRRLARDQWVRIHGTPRVTVLAGGARAKEVWSRWTAVTSNGGRLLEGGAVEQLVHAAIADAVAQPQMPIAIVASLREIEAWRTNRRDRAASMLDEGLLVIDEHSTPVRTSNLPIHVDARSAAEAALFEALEATLATAGRFRLNEYLSVKFGDGAAEVDLLARAERIAIEIDGYHHFTDLDRYRRDRRKDLLLQTQDLLVLRFLAEDVMSDPRDAVTVVCQALAHRMKDTRR